MCIRDSIGGIPQVEFTREDGIRAIKYAFELAERYDKLIDIHTDETGDPQSRFLEVIAKYALESGLKERVSASHTTAMHNYDNDYTAKPVSYTHLDVYKRQTKGYSVYHLLYKLFHPITPISQFKLDAFGEVAQTHQVTFLWL